VGTHRPQTPIALMSSNDHYPHQIHFSNINSILAPGRRAEIASALCLFPSTKLMSFVEAKIPTVLRAPNFPTFITHAFPFVRDCDCECECKCTIKCTSNCICPCHLCECTCHRATSGIVNYSHSSLQCRSINLIEMKNIILNAGMVARLS
jgi:hypothetical protein